MLNYKRAPFRRRPGLEKIITSTVIVLTTYIYALAV